MSKRTTVALAMASVNDDYLAVRELAMLKLQQRETMPKDDMLAIILNDIANGELRVREHANDARFLVWAGTTSLDIDDIFFRRLSRLCVDLFDQGALAFRNMRCPCVRLMTVDEDGNMLDRLTVSNGTGSVMTRRRSAQINIDPLRADILPEQLADTITRFEIDPVVLWCQQLYQEPFSGTTSMVDPRIGRR